MRKIKPLRVHGYRMFRYDTRDNNIVGHNGIKWDVPTFDRLLPGTAGVIKAEHGEWVGVAVR
jgi:hypothetical protein